MQVSNFNIHGLTTEEVEVSRANSGSNVLTFKKVNPVLLALKKLVTEPMVILLLAAALIYFVAGNFGDAIFMTLAIFLVSAISLYQDSRSRHALEKLRAYTQPSCKVIRNGKVEEIRTSELVLGDYLMVEEGILIAADALIIHANDFQVSEAMLTGESLPVYKDPKSIDPCIYQGTYVTGGLAIAKVTAIGNRTRLGAIGKSLETIRDERTPLEKQINNFVKKMVVVGSVVFLVVWAINFSRSSDWLDSLLKALTLAMSILPEEIPVAFTTFMAIGAWRLMRSGIVVKQMKTVETLGSATVICSDKTGTITENKMSLARLYVHANGKISQPGPRMEDEEKKLIGLAMWASEPIPFDPMEQALHESYARYFEKDERQEYSMVHEYPLGGNPPMMTHVFQNNHGEQVIASKGAPEAFLEIAGLDENEKQKVLRLTQEFGKEGYRVLAVCEVQQPSVPFPVVQQDFKFSLKGLVAFYDPPKRNMQKVFSDFYSAGIDVKIVSGDNAATTIAIAKETGLKGYEKNLTGEEIMNLKDEQLKQLAPQTFVFSRMFPDAKLRLINALKENREVVAMTGDGVNDGPALKAAHIGIAMGRGTEIAKQAASLVLQDDDLSRMVTAISMGRRIYANLKKAIQYIISIHIPIILTVFLPLVLGWIYPNIFSPVHVIFMELIMGPTCSIIYENEPVERNLMLEKPRPFTTTFFNWRELAGSIFQGLMITAGTLLAYRYAVVHDYDENLTRTMVFTTLISANIFLTLVNRSFYFSILTTLRYKNPLVPLIITITIVLMAMLLYLKPLSTLFQFTSPSPAQLLTSIGFGFASVMWFELYKFTSSRVHKFTS